MISGVPGEFAYFQNQEKQKIENKKLRQTDFAKNMNQKGLTKDWPGNKNLFLRDKKFIQPKTEQGQSFNKNK
ncbi:MAG: hypothetical protein IJU86_03415 [Firmicutes bacterium]|nr:hypothetical protein [Bacillota bacterium]